MHRTVTALCKDGSDCRGARRRICGLQSTCLYQHPSGPATLSSRTCGQDIKHCRQANVRSRHAAGRVRQPFCAHAGRAVAARLIHRVFTLACNSTTSHSRTGRCNRGVKVSDAAPQCLHLTASHIGATWHAHHGNPIQRRDQPMSLQPEA